MVVAKLSCTLMPVAGIAAGAVNAGIRRDGRADLTLFTIDAGATVAAVFTRNAFCAAPVTLARVHLRQATPRALLINSGNANAGLGEGGINSARQTCLYAAEALGIDLAEVLPFSTGVIGEPLPVQAFAKAMPRLVQQVQPDGWAAAALAIMTTDTVPKGAYRQVTIAGQTVTITGIAKGSGMLRPDMATMLAFVACDAAVATPLLETMLREVVADTFNAVSVDGDMSTNDACVLIATGKAGVTVDTVDAHYRVLVKAVHEVCAELAEALVRDGEGVTKLIDIQVEGGSDVTQCRRIAYAIAHSPLCKTAFFAADANWGRILAAVGAAQTDLDVRRIAIHLDDVVVVENGARAPSYSEADGTRILRQAEFSVRVDLGVGTAAARVLTADLSHEYIRINATYRS